MSKLPKHILNNLSSDKSYYSLDSMTNIERCKVDPDYLGDVLLVNENLIWHSVHKYIGKPEVIVKNNNCVEKDDILQLGRMGFIKAIYAFDTTRGVKFSSFSVTAIVREIRCFLRDSANIIRPTRTANELIGRINRVAGELGYLPSVDDLVVLLDEDRDKITKALQVGLPVKYLEDPISNSDSSTANMTLMDSLDSSDVLEDDVLDKVYMDSIIDELKNKLSETEINVLQLRMQGYSQTQTAVSENITQMKVNRIMRKIANMMTEHPEFKQLLGNT